MNKVCFVDDEQNIRRLVAYDLKQAGYDFALCANGKEAYELSLKERFDAYIIDWMMPELDGISLVKKLRADKKDAILIMLTAKAEEEDLIEAFDAGVDDYLTKPFSSRELMVRIKAHLSRIQSKPETKLILKDVSINLMNREVTLKDKAIDLTKTEFDLLLYFAENPNTVLSRDQVLNKIWGFDYDGDTRIVDVHVFKLRSKLETSAVTIKSIRGVGYLLENVHD